MFYFKIAEIDLAPKHSRFAVHAFFTNREARRNPKLVGHPAFTRLYSSAKVAFERRPTLWLPRQNIAILCKFTQA